MSRHYWCARCEVVGEGDECWSCDRSDRLVTEGPQVDNLVYDSELT